eukprot:CAMPEP_0176053422 /NCGR_PEP_ID=MMETSP0120_2-20121206/26572_1 /TAXON_ID=160619 /ORGANISM="Kryptoperidinium foliaceum, Strain CCMP 1326" /LENGTH=53 /DNA_ID=CAMNT_0017386877 /DNA_START=536 /DNA_END=697 /DNA_ORIENTATION=+
MPMWPTQGQQQVSGCNGPQTTDKGKRFIDACTGGTASSSSEGPAVSDDIIWWP